MKLIRSLIFKQYLFSLYLFISNSWFSRSLKIGQIPPKKFVVISRSRTGSTMLIKNLRTLPNSFVVGEVLGRSRGFLFWKRFIRMFYKYHWKGIQIVGFKYFYYHPVDNMKLRKEFFNYLKLNKEIIIIHLIREDLFAVLLSRIIAEETGQWSKKKGNIKLKPFLVDIQKFRNDLVQTLSQIGQTNQLFAKRENCLIVSYEEIISGSGLEKIYDIIGIDGQSVFPISKKGKQKSADKYEMILNFTQLKEIYDQENKAFSNYS